MTVVDLHVREAGSGLPVVLLHAFPLSSAMWLEQRNDLGDAFRIITPDLRGFGGSQLGYDEPSLDHMADDVAALLDTLALDRVVLGGLSMGGYVAMAFLRRHGERVAGLLLADTKASADPEAARANRHRIADALDESGTTQVLLDDVLPALLGETTVVERPMIQGRVRALVEDAPPAGRRLGAACDGGSPRLLRHAARRHGAGARRRRRAGRALVAGRRAGHGRRAARRPAGRRATQRSPDGGRGTRGVQRRGTRVPEPRWADPRAELARGGPCAGWSPAGSRAAPRRLSGSRAARR